MMSAWPAYYVRSTSTAWANINMTISVLTIFPEEVDLRNDVAQNYADLMGGIDKLQIPKVTEGAKSSWAQYSLLAGNESQREKLRARLSQENIPTVIYYPKPLHIQEVFAPLGYREGDFPVSEECSRRIFSLPMHPYVQAQDQEKIAEILARES
jgi:dTDP-4-amino-4,6-dideoxygalactose transaminase